MSKQRKNRFFWSYGASAIIRYFRFPVFNFRFSMSDRSLAVWIYYWFSTDMVMIQKRWLQVTCSIFNNVGWLKRVVESLEAAAEATTAAVHRGRSLTEKASHKRSGWTEIWVGSFSIPHWLLSVDTFRIGHWLLAGFGNVFTFCVMATRYLQWWLGITATKWIL